LRDVDSRIVFGAEFGVRIKVQMGSLRSAFKPLLEPLHQRQSHPMTDVILYTTDDGRSQIKLRAEQHTVWLTQLEMADLFDATKQNISLHLKNIFEDGELDPAATVKQTLTVQIEAGRTLTTEESSVVQMEQQ